MDRFTRRLFVKHKTEFVYDGYACESVNEIRLAPVDGPRQQVEFARLTVTPAADQAESIDVWGNRVWWCQIVDEHPTLRIEAEAAVAMRGPISLPPEPDGGWSMLASDAYREPYADALPPSELVAWSDVTRAFADRLAVAPQGRVGAWTRDLAHALNDALTYERGATDVTTTVDDVIAAGRGVCQDFAHVFVALCRMHGVAARYVSGWLFESDREGPVESHAWAEVNIPGVGWVEEDPTHVGEVSDRYVRIGCGRDYADVVPIKGTYVGGATMSMTVDVELDERAPEGVDMAAESVRGE